MRIFSKICALTVFVLLGGGVIQPSCSQTLTNTGSVDVPVAGDSSAATVTQTQIAHPDSPILPITRTLVNKFSDIPTARDYGMLLEPDQGGPDINWLDAHWSTFTRDTPIILPTGTHWPDNRYVPNSGSVSKRNSNQFPIVMALGGVESRPGYNTPYGYGVPYYGDVVPSFTHDDANFTFSRVDSNESSAGNYVRLGLFSMVYDTPFEGGSTGTSTNQASLESHVTTTPKMKGTVGNFVTTFDSKGYNYYGEMDVSKWSHTVNRGTNWVWDNIQEMYDAEPFYCDPSDASLCFAEYMNEEDMYGAGPEAKASAYDPTVHNRMMFWLTTNHNINYNDTQSDRWSASMLVPVHKIIFVKNSSNNHDYMFEGTHVGYVSNSSSSVTGTVSGNTLTVNSVSPGATITPGSTYINGNLLTDEVLIVSQVSGTPGGVGSYTISASQSASGYTTKTATTFYITTNKGAKFSTTGATQPTWTFNTGDTFTDGTTSWTCIGPWQYDLGIVFAIGGANDPTNGFVERIGTVMSETTDWIYNAIIDMSKAAFDPSVPYNVFARLQKNMWIDFSASGTQDSQNNHLLGYYGGYSDSSGSHTGEFKFMVSKAASANGSAFTAMMLGDDGTVDFPGLGTSHKNSGSHYVCIDDNGGIFKSDKACVSN